MEPFTDEYLQDLKYACEFNQPPSKYVREINCAELLSLISRLEAAESKAVYAVHSFLCAKTGNFNAKCECGLDLADEVWCKAAGRS